MMTPLQATSKIIEMMGNRDVMIMLSGTDMLLAVFVDDYGEKEISEIGHVGGSSAYAEVVTNMHAIGVAVDQAKGAKH